MKDYTIYFDIRGKKLKTIIKAKSQDEAVQKLRASLKIDKIETPPDNTFFDMWNTIIKP